MGWGIFPQLPSARTMEMSAAGTEACDKSMPSSNPGHLFGSQTEASAGPGPPPAPAAWLSLGRDGSVAAPQLQGSARPQLPVTSVIGGALWLPPWPPCFQPVRKAFLVSSCCRDPSAPGWSPRRHLSILSLSRLLSGGLRYKSLVGKQTHSLPGTSAPFPL